MKRLKRKLKKTKRFARYLYYIVLIAYIISYSFFVKSVVSLTGIETLIRYLILIIMLCYFFVYLYYSLIKLLKKKYGSFYLLSLLSIIFIIIFSCSSFIIGFLFNKLDDFKEKDMVTYTSYLVTLKETKLTNASKLAIIEDENDIEGYVLANEIIEKYDLKQDIVYYDNYLSMLYDLYEGDIDGVFISGNYRTLYSSEEKFASIDSETKIVHKVSKEYENADKQIISNKVLTEPFTALIMGVDSEHNGLNANASFNGDTLILATFNPKTYNVTLLSIPRDTYVPIACKKGKYAKINSSAAYGTECVIDTIEDFTDITIDYYVKINFKGVVDLVEALGGVEVNVEQPDYKFNHGNNCKGMVCEQDSSRRWGKHTIYIEPGWQKLNGEQALAYARCRGLYAESDLARNRHQQEIITAMAQKLLDINSYNGFKKVLDTISKNISTNMSTSQILTGYEVMKGMIGNVLQDGGFVNIQKSYLETYPMSVYISSSNHNTSALGYYESSIKDIISQMKMNLEIEKPKLTKTFEFDINENYESYVAGAGLRSGSTNDVFQSFIGKLKSDAISYCDKNDLECSFVYVDSNSEYFNEKIDKDLIGYQNPKQNTLLREVSKATFYINEESSLEKNENSNENTSESEE